MIIQCKEKCLNDICELLKVEPVVKEEPGGYIDCWDKGWLFVKTNDTKILDFLSTTQTSYVIGMQDTNTIIQRNVCEHEQYIVIRKIDNEYELLWGAGTYLNFKEVE